MSHRHRMYTVNNGTGYYGNEVRFPCSDKCTQTASSTTTSIAPPSSSVTVRHVNDIVSLSSYNCPIYIYIYHSSHTMYSLYSYIWLTQGRLVVIRLTNRLYFYLCHVGQLIGYLCFITSRCMMGCHGNGGLRAASRGG